MKLLITDNAGAEHDLDAVVLGMANDLYRINQRLIRVEEELGISYQEAEAEAIADSEAEDVRSQESV